MFKKIFTKALLINVLLAIGIVVGLLFLIQSGLRSYTRHGESITVPDFRGMTFEQVKAMLQSKNLNWEIMDSVYDMSKPSLSIVDQNPKPQSKVKEGRTIYFTINATNAPTTEIPDLIGKSSYKNAIVQLQSYGLKVGEPIYKPDPFLNTGIGIEINGRPVTRKMRVPKGTIIQLVLGDGQGNGTLIPIPDLVGQRYEEVEFQLKANGLIIGALTMQGDITDTAGAVVYRQLPAYQDGKNVRLGEAIDLWIAKELPAGIVVNPPKGSDSIPRK